MDDPWTTLRGGEEAPIIPTTMRNHLLTLDVLNVMGGGGGGHEGDDIENRVVGGRGRGEGAGGGCSLCKLCAFVIFRIQLTRVAL